MSYKIIINATAKNDFAEAYYYYQKISHKLANNFKKEVKLKINSLEINPFYQVRIKSYKAIPLNKFPFLVFYELDEVLKEVQVLAIFNTNQSESKYPQ